MTRKFLTALILVLAGCGSTGGSAPGSQMVTGQERGGGDDTGLEFNQALSMSVNELQTLALPEASNLNFAQLKTALGSVAVLVVDQPLETQNGDVMQNSTAQNDRSKNQILVNRSRWHDLASNGLRKALALHEVLSLIGAESTGHYPISTAYMIKLGLSDDPNILDVAAVCVAESKCLQKDPLCVLVSNGALSVTDLNVVWTKQYSCTDKQGRTSRYSKPEYKVENSFSGGGPGYTQWECNQQAAEISYGYQRCAAQ